MATLTKSLPHGMESKTVFDGKVILCIFRIPVFVCGTWIPDFNVPWDSVFLEPYSRFQSPGFRTQQAKVFRILDSTSKNFVDSGIGFPYMVRKSSLKMTISATQGAGDGLGRSFKPRRTPPR